MVTITSMPSGKLSSGGGAGSGSAVNGGVGALEIRVAPSNTNIFYMIWHANIYRSSNRGVTWTTLTTPWNYISGGNEPPVNGSNGGKYLAIDPNDANTVYVSSYCGLAYKTTDGGANSTSVPNATTTPVVNNKSAGHLIQMDGSTKIYIHISGDGLWYSSNSGSSFSKVTGGPVDHTRM